MVYNVTLHMSTVKSSLPHHCLIIASLDAVALAVHAVLLHLCTLARNQTECSWCHNAYCLIIASPLDTAALRVHAVLLHLCTIC
jgi:hypothetical protein